MHRKASVAGAAEGIRKEGLPVRMDGQPSQSLFDVCAIVVYLASFQGLTKQFLPGRLTASFMDNRRIRPHPIPSSREQ